MGIHFLGKAGEKNNIRKQKISAVILVLESVKRT